MDLFFFHIEWKKTTHVYLMLFAIVFRMRRDREKNGTKENILLIQTTEREWKKRESFLFIEKIQKLVNGITTMFGIFIVWILTYIFINDTSK